MFGCCCCFYFVFYVFSSCDLCFCRFFQLLFVVHFSFSFSRFRLYCNLQFQTRRAFASALILCCLFSSCCCCCCRLLYILSLCNARRETTIAMHNNIISLISEFSVFFTDQQNETLRRVASWTNRTPPLKFYKWLRFALSFSYKNKHAKSARAALSRSHWEHATRSAVS